MASKKVLSGKKVTAKSPTTGALAEHHRKQALAKQIASLGLPRKRKAPVLDVQQYSILLYGPPKIGKTTFFASFPDILFLTFEPGTKGMEIFEFNAEHGGVTDWSVMLRAIELLEQNPKRFKSVVIDTAEEAYSMCMDHECARMGIDYPGVTAAGVNDRGKSWKAVKRAFLVALHRIDRTGRGVHFTSHAKEDTIKERSGGEFTKIVPSMTGQARSIVEPFVDHIFYADYMKQDGRNVRVITTEGSELVVAGARETALNPFPGLLPMVKKNGYGMLMAALSGEKVGLDPTKLMPSRSSLKTMEKYMDLVKAEAKLKASLKRIKKGGRTVG